MMMSMSMAMMMGNACGGTGDHPPLIESSQPIKTKSKLSSKIHHNLQNIRRPRTAPSSRLIEDRIDHEPSHSHLASSSTNLVRLDLNLSDVDLAQAFADDRIPNRSSSSKHRLSTFELIKSFSHRPSSLLVQDPKPSSSQTCPIVPTGEEEEEEQEVLSTRATVEERPMTTEPAIHDPVDLFHPGHPKTAQPPPRRLRAGSTMSAAPSISNAFLKRFQKLPSIFQSQSNLNPTSSLPSVSNWISTNSSPSSSPSSSSSSSSARSIQSSLSNQCLKQRSLNSQNPSHRLSSGTIHTYQGDRIDPSAHPELACGHDDSGAVLLPPRSIRACSSLSFSFGGRSSSQHSDLGKPDASNTTTVIGHVSDSNPQCTSSPPDSPSPDHRTRSDSHGERSSPFSIHSLVPFVLYTFSFVWGFFSG